MRRTTRGTSPEDVGRKTNKSALKPHIGLATVRAVPIERLEVQNSTYHRFHGIDEKVVDRYADLLRSGEVFPPVLVYLDEQEDRYWLADGFCRVRAHASAGRTEIRCEVRFGNKLDAAIAGVSRLYNDAGQRITNLDKRTAVLNILRDPTIGDWSDVDIARLCKVTHPFVGKLRREHWGKSPETVSRASNQVILHQLDRKLDDTLKLFRQLKSRGVALDERLLKVLEATEKYLGEYQQRTGSTCWEVTDKDNAA